MTRTQKLSEILVKNSYFGLKLNKKCNQSHY